MREYQSEQSGSRLRLQVLQPDVSEDQRPATFQQQPNLAAVPRVATRSGTARVSPLAMLPHLSTASPTVARSALLQLQHHQGNHQVQRLLQMTRDVGGEAAVEPEVESAIESGRWGGQLLDSTVQAQMEQAFNADFSGVRVHADAKADALNQTLSARAFTTGQDIFFRQGEYNPYSSGGNELLAHELTHVVQQGAGGIQGKLSVSRGSDPFEHEAEQAANEVAQPQSGGRQENCSSQTQFSHAGVAARAATDPQKLPDGEVIFDQGTMRYKDPSIQSRLQTMPYAGAVSHTGGHPMIQMVGECDRKNNRNCSGKCEPRAGAGMRGVCQWGGVTYGCRCRDRSGDEPPPAATATAEPGTLANPIVYSDLRDRKWEWQLGDEDWFSTDWAARFQVFAMFGKTAWGSGVAWVLDEVNASRQTVTGLSGEVNSITSRYFIIGGQLVFTLRIQLRFKTSDITQTTSTSIGASLSTDEKTSIGASVPIEGATVSAGAERSRGAGLNLSKTWGTERVLAGSTFDVTREYKFTNNGTMCTPQLINSFDPDPDMIGDVPGLESWIRGTPDWTIESSLFFGVLPLR